MITPINIELVYTNKYCYEWHHRVADELHIPFTGVLVAGIVYDLFDDHQAQFAMIPSGPEMPDSGVPFAHRHHMSEEFMELVKTRKTWRKISDNAYMHQSLLVILRQPEIIDQWYRFSVPGLGSGKISKTK